MKRTITLFAIVIALSVSALAQKYKYEPSILYSNLLGNIKIQDDGRLRLLTLTGVFLDANKGNLRILLDGSEIANYTFVVSQSNKPFSQIDNFMHMRNSVMNPRGFKLTQGGKYTFIYEANGNAFQRFSFDVKKKNVGTKYKAKHVWTKEGDWSKYAYLLLDKKYDGKLQFKFYVRGDLYEADCNSELSLIQDSDKKLIVNSFMRPCWQYSEWRRAEQTFRLPLSKVELVGNSEADRFNLNSYTFKDGSYTIKQKINSKLHATYKFSVKGGKIQRQDRQVRGFGDHLDYMEGGKEVIWLKKQ